MGLVFAHHVMIYHSRVSLFSCAFFGRDPNEVLMIHYGVKIDVSRMGQWHTLKVPNKPAVFRKHILWSLAANNRLYYMAICHVYIYICLYTYICYRFVYMLYMYVMYVMYVLCMYICVMYVCNSVRELKEEINWRTATWTLMMFRLISEIRGNFHRQTWLIKRESLGDRHLQF